MRGAWRIAFAAPLLTFGLGAASAVAHLGPAKPLCAQAADTNHVGIVIEHDNVVKHQCVGFTSSTVTALTVLQNSGIEYATQLYNGIGEAVCQIDNVPMHYTDCLPSSGDYWVFFVANPEGVWTSSAHGVSTTTLSDGDYIGFRYDALTGADPPPPSPIGVCPLPPTPTPVPTAQATPTPVATVAPGATSHPAPPTQSASGAGSPTASGSTATASNSATPVDGVLGASTPQTSPVPALGVATKAVIDSPFNPALVIAVIAIAALIALVGIQGLRRRRQ